MSSPTKSSLRETYRQKREALPQDEHAQASKACCSRLVSYIGSLKRPSLVIAGYAAIRRELDVMPALHALAASHTVALPVTEEGKTLTFRRFAPGDGLAKGHFGISVPADTAHLVVPDLLIVPLIAFDRSCHRLGWGVGYYDRTLKELRSVKPIIAIGVGFALQESDSLPADKHDEALDIIVTERDIIIP